MKVLSACLVLLTTGFRRAAAGGIPDANMVSEEETYTAGVDPKNDNGILYPQRNYGGWVNPEDLPPMPQCIAQQDHSTWLSTMTRCTSKRCTSHFGVICTHHQWLTHLSCLSTGFSSDIIRSYLPYCGRSVLAKAQLYHWIRSIAGRTWLVEVGDANGLEHLSPDSLPRGYAAVDVVDKAPACLTNSGSAISTESFQQVMASCSFTSTTEHTGNPARPWEYSERLRSMIALDFETVGYDLIGYSIGYGDYFDRECLCSAFTMNPEQEPCSTSGPIALTRERLWMSATCGPKSLPANWKDNLKTTEFMYIPTEDWHWPTCVADMPKRVIEFTDECTTDACELDSSGYCKLQLKRAIDRACFCRNISYNSCAGPCHVFENRIDYVNWLHNLCGSVPDWDGLPENWRQLAGPTQLDMIPWKWTIKPSSESNLEQCPSNEWKLGSFALANITTLLAIFFTRRPKTRQKAHKFLWKNPYQTSWIAAGVAIAALQPLANWFNALHVQQTRGYEGVPITQLVLLWCSMPRLAWLVMLRIGGERFETVKASLLAETVLQVLGAYNMIWTVDYGLRHGFYFGGLNGMERGGSAKVMYAGALLWVVTISGGLSQVLRVIRRWTKVSESGSHSCDLPKQQRSERTTSKIAEEVEELSAWLDDHITWLGERMAYRRTSKRNAFEETPLIRDEGEDYTGYGTLPAKLAYDWVGRKAFAKLYGVAVISMFLLWIAQWLFWSGFIGLSAGEYCLPKLELLTPVWITSALMGAGIEASL